MPARGFCAVTMPDWRSEFTSTTVASRSRCVSSATAVSRDLPTTNGTVTFGLPVETSTVTMLSFGSRVPGSGSCWKTYLGCTSPFGRRTTLASNPSPTIRSTAFSSRIPV